MNRKVRKGIAVSNKDREEVIKMKKRVVVLCKNGQQFGIAVEADEANDIAEMVVERVTQDTNDRGFMDLCGFITNNTPKNKMFIDVEQILSVLVVDENNIAVPNKNIFMPSRGRN